MEIINQQLAVHEDTKNGMAVELFKSIGQDKAYRVRILDTDTENNVALYLFDNLILARKKFDDCASKL